MREQRLRTKIAEDLHDEVGSSLTRIYFQADMPQMQSRSIAEDKTALEKIAASSKEALGVMSDMVWSIDAQFDTTDDLVSRIRDYINHLQNDLDISVTLELRGDYASRPLSQMIRQGLFREDLYYRLNVVPLRLPPLRERVEDIPDLVRHFLRKAEDEGLPHKSLDNEALDMLRRHRWPGNVRELENLIRRLAVLHSGDTIPAAAVAGELKEPARTFAVEEGEGPQSLSASVEQYLTQYFLSQGDRLPPPGVYDRVVQEVERPLISICLAATRGNQIRAAQLLGLNRNTLRKKIRDLGLEVIRGLRAE